MRTSDVVAQMALAELYRRIPVSVETLYHGDADGVGSTVEMSRTGMLVMVDRCAVYPVRFRVGDEPDPVRIERVATFFAKEIGDDLARLQAFVAQCRPLVIEGGEQFYIECVWGSKWA